MSHAATNRHKAAVTPAVAPDYYADEAELKFLLYLRDVVVTFDGFRALDIDAFGVFHNELRVIIGPNGAGKTTLLQNLMGVRRPASGRIELQGKDVARWPAHKRVHAGLGLVPQGRHIFPRLSVEENLRIGQVLQQLVREMQMTVILVEQYLDFVREIGQDVYILDGGQVVAQTQAGAISQEMVHRHLSV